VARPRTCRAAANLRKALHYARRAIAADEGVGLIASVGESLSLPTEGLYVDVDAWRTATARARRGGDPAAYAEALGIYRGDLLPEDR
jgi:DNA-binding SARP family transcriptional activator